jgi:hypothetical protein
MARTLELFNQIWAQIIPKAAVGTTLIAVVKAIDAGRDLSNSTNR